MTANNARSLTEQAIKDAQTLNSIMWEIHARTQIRENYLELPFVPNGLVRHRLKSQGFMVQVCSKNITLITWAEKSKYRTVVLKIDEGIYLREDGTEVLRVAMLGSIGGPTYFKIRANILPDELYFRIKAQTALGIALWLEADVVVEALKPENFVLDSLRVAKNICLLGL